MRTLSSLLPFSLLLFCSLSALLPASPSEYYWESREPIYEKSRLLQLGEKIQFSINLADAPTPVKRILHVTGYVPMPAPYDGRGEGNFRRWIYSIDDSLQEDKLGFSLLFSTPERGVEQRAYYRLSPSLLKAGKFCFSMRVKRKDFQVEEGGSFELKLEFFKNSATRHPDDIHDAADRVIELKIDAAASDEDFVCLTQEFELEEDMASCLISLGGRDFSGECLVGDLQLQQDEKALADLRFTKSVVGQNDKWVGVNLCHRAYPEFEVKIGGRSVFSEAVFDRASNVADFYIFLPSDLASGEQLLEFQLKDSGRLARFPYQLYEIAMIEQSARDFELVALPQYQRLGESFGALIETNRKDVSLHLESEGGLVAPQSEFHFKEKGLHVIQLQAADSGKQPSFTLSDGLREEQHILPQFIIKEDDRVFLSSGDEIHIDKKRDEYDQFFKWYVGSQVGNMLQFRPSYQWSGVRSAPTDFYKHYTELLCDLHMPYAYQVEGRTIPGTAVNPDVSVLDSPFFLGKQAHENDGAFNYWAHIGWEGLYSDLMARYLHKGGIFPKVRPIREGEGRELFFSRTQATNMEEAAAMFVQNLAQARGQSTRHTGPSVLFRYFLQAGYTWVGAEQMYGPEELILSALRGASHAYGDKDYGSLHAMQWGSAPFDDSRHVTRFFNSLALAYMHGASNINTEEGIWTDEFANNRFTDAGHQHHMMQTRLLNFIRTQQRNGEMQRKIAFIQGRNDGWRCFISGGSIWGQKGEQWAPGAAEASFDLLKIFYPESRLDAVIHCSNPDTAQGWYSTTPYGAVDLLPIEASADALKQYDCLVFAGWNTFNLSDFERLVAWVKQGGTLMLSRAHLNENLIHNAPVKVALHPLLVELLGARYAAASGVVQRELGKGKVIFFASDAYPSEPEIQEAYSQQVRALAEEYRSQQMAKGWVLPSPNIGFSCWQQVGDRMRVLYLLNIDWWSSSVKHPAIIALGGKQVEVAVKRRQILPVTILEERIMIVPASMGTRVISFNDGVLRIQSVEADIIRVICDGVERRFALKKAGVHNIHL